MTPRVRHRAGLAHTDPRSAYGPVLPEGQHRATGNGAGQTCHVERFDNVPRQRLFLDEHNQPGRETPSRRTDRRLGRH